MHIGHGIIPLLCMPVMISYPRLAALIYPVSHLSIVTSFPISLHPPSAHPIKLDPIPIYLNQPQPPTAFPCFVCANPTSLLGSIVALSHVTMTLQRRIPTPFPPNHRINPDRPSAHQLTTPRPNGPGAASPRPFRLLEYPLPLLLLLFLLAHRSPSPRPLLPHRRASGNPTLYPKTSTERTP